MNSMSINGRGIKTFLNTTVIYSTVELKAKRLQCNTVTMANCGFLQKCVTVITVCLPEPTFDDHWISDFDIRAFYHVQT